MNYLCTLVINPPCKAVVGDVSAFFRSARHGRHHRQKKKITPFVGEIIARQQMGIFEVLIAGFLGRKSSRRKSRRRKRRSTRFTAAGNAHRTRSFDVFAFPIHRGCKIGLFPVFGVVTAKSTVVVKDLRGVGIGVDGAIRYKVTRRLRDFCCFIASGKSVPN